MEGESAVPPTLFEHVDDSGGDLLSKIAGRSGSGLSGPGFGRLVPIRSFLLGEIRGPETGLYVLGIVGGGSEREPREYSDHWAAIDDDPRGG